MLAPIWKPAPVTGDMSQGRAIGIIHDDAIPIFIYENVLEEILNYSEQDLTRELGGFLVGGLYEDRRVYIEVRHFLPAVKARSRAASLTFTHDTWSAMTRQVEEQFPGDVVVGWQHTHPGFGIFLSAYDMFIHRHFFSQPWQIAMVVDPRRKELGFFQWSQGDVVDCGFVCVWQDEGKR